MLNLNLPGLRTPPCACPEVRGSSEPRTGQAALKSGLRGSGRAHKAQSMVPGPVATLLRDLVELRVDGSAGGKGALQELKELQSRAASVLSLTGDGDRVQAGLPASSAADIRGSGPPGPRQGV